MYVLQNKLNCTMCNIKKPGAYALKSVNILRSNTISIIVYEKYIL